MTEREKYLKYHSSTLAKKRRAARNKAHAQAVKKYGKSALRGKDVDHINKNTGGNLSDAPGNVRVIPVSKNRSKDANDWRKTKKRNT